MASKKAKAKKRSKPKKSIKKRPAKAVAKKAPSKKISVKKFKAAPKGAVVKKEQYEKLRADFSRMKIDYTACLWAFVKWCGVAFNYVGEKLGEEEARKYSEYIAEVFARPMFEKGGVATLRDLKWFVDVLGSDFKWIEDDKKIVLTGTCNSGGRLEREGISKRNRAGVSYYCSHCKQWYTELAKEWYDLDIQFEYRKDGKGCTFTFMK